MSISASSVREFIKSDPVLVFAVVLALISLPLRMPRIEDIDLDVLILLFDLMIVIAAFSELHIPNYCAIRLIGKCGNRRHLAIVLVAAVWFSSMFITNDVALLTFVPLTIVIAKETGMNMLSVCIFQTLAANIGSSLTPMGNPQNLFLYLHYNLSFYEMLRITAPFVIAATVFLMIFLLREKPQKAETKREIPKTGSKLKTAAFAALFIFTILSVGRVIPAYYAFIATALVTLVLEPKLFRKVNYSLLITFVGFFIFVANVSSLPEVSAAFSSMLDTPAKTYLAGLISSQFISNVPAAVLLSGFTNNASALINGVNVGGMGTIIASMASVITYKLYSSAFPREAMAYLKKFTVLNIVMLIPSAVIIYFFI